MRLDENLVHDVLIRLNPEQMDALDSFARSETSPRTRIMRLAMQAGLVVMNRERDAFIAHRDAQQRFDRLVLGD